MSVRRVVVVAPRAVVLQLVSSDAAWASVEAPSGIRSYRRENADSHDITVEWAEEASERAATVAVVHGWQPALTMLAVLGTGALGSHGVVVGNRLTECLADGEGYEFARTRPLALAARVVRDATLRRHWHASPSLGPSDPQLGVTLTGPVADCEGFARWAEQHLEPPLIATAGEQIHELEPSIILATEPSEEAPLPARRLAAAVACVLEIADSLIAEVEPESRLTAAPVQPAAADPVADPIAREPVEPKPPNSNAEAATDPPTGAARLIPLLPWMFAAALAVVGVVYLLTRLSADPCSGFEMSLSKDKLEISERPDPSCRPPSLRVHVKDGGAKGQAYANATVYVGRAVVATGPNGYGEIDQVEGSGAISVARGETELEVLGSELEGSGEAGYDLYVYVREPSNPCAVVLVDSRDEVVVVDSVAASWGRDDERVAVSASHDKEGGTWSFPRCPEAEALVTLSIQRGSAHHVIEELAGELLQRGGRVKLPGEPGPKQVPVPVPVDRASVSRPIQPATAVEERP